MGKITNKECFTAKSDRFGINYCKDYFDSIKNMLLNEEDTGFNDTILIIIKSDVHDPATDIYINNKIKTLNIFNIQTVVIPFPFHKENLDNDIDMLLSVIKMTCRKDDLFRTKFKNQYYILQKDNSIKDIYTDIYTKLNEKIIKRNIKLYDVELLETFNTPFFNKQNENIKKFDNVDTDKCDFLIGPCTPIGAINMLLFYNKIHKGDNCIVYGKSEILGMPLLNTLIKCGCTVLSFNSLSKEEHFIDSFNNINTVFLCMDNIDFMNINQLRKYNHNVNIIDFGINVKNVNGIRKISGNITDEVLKKYKDDDSIDGIITATPSGTALSTLIQIVINIFIMNKVQLERK